MAANKWEGPPCLAFKIPNTDVEIIAFAAGTTLRGLVCNPKRLLSPTPWSGACSHCQQGGQDRKWGKAAMEAVRIMCSTKLVPPNAYNWEFSPHHKARGKLNPDGWNITIENPDKNLLLTVIHLNNQPPMLIGLAREFRSEHVRRGIKLILSGRVPADNEVEACMMGLREAKPPVVGTPCWDWDLSRRLNE